MSSAGSQYETEQAAKVAEEAARVVAEPAVKAPVQTHDVQWLDETLPPDEPVILPEDFDNQENE